MSTSKILYKIKLDYKIQYIFYKSKGKTNLRRALLVITELLNPRKIESNQKKIRVTQWVTLYKCSD